MPNETDEPREAREVTCFVIGPIGDKDADRTSLERQTYEEAIEVLEEVIRPACEAFGIAPLRADEIAMPGEIPEQVCRHLRDAHVVIADLTGGNPNVMYELGLRHTTGKLTIQIGERGRLPFDVAAIRTTLFRRTPGGLVEARRKLTAAIAAGLEKGSDPVSATRVWFEGQAVVTTSGDSALTLADDDGEELGFLEKLTEMSEGIDSATINLEATTMVIHEVNQLVTEATAQINNSNAAGGDPGARLFITNTLADKLSNPASRLEVLAGEYRRSIERMDAGMIFALSGTRERPDDTEAQAFRSQVRQFITAAEDTWPSLDAFRESLLESGESARSLRRVNRRIAATLQTMRSVQPIFAKWKELL